MPIARNAERLWQHDAGRIDSLEYAVAIHATRHFANQHWREPMMTQLLVHAQEVDLDRLKGLVVDARVTRRRRNQSDELLRRRHAHADVIFRAPAR